MLIPLGTITCTSNSVDYRLTTNRVSPTAYLPAQTVMVQQKPSQTGTITIRMADPETGNMTNTMVLVPPATGAQPVSIALSVPSGQNALNVESIYIRASVNGEGALCFCIQT